MLCVLSDCVCLGHGVDAAVFDREQYFSFGLCVGKNGTTLMQIAD